MRIHEALTRATHLLEMASCPNSRFDAEVLLCFHLRNNRGYLLAHSRDDLAAAQLEGFWEGVEKRCQGMPAQYVVGMQEFRGLEFEVSPEVLIPRPETELLVGEVLRCFPEGPVTLVDVGTGSGCIAISLAVERSEARLFAIDLSGKALEVARRNAVKHGVETNIRFLEGDLLSPLSLVAQAESIDGICSNPPYVAEGDLPALQREVRDWEPRVALAGGLKGLSLIERLVPQALHWLRPGGYLSMEIGYNQQEQVCALFGEEWQDLRLNQDFSGIPRLVTAQKRSSPAGIYR